jgi:hypothetical protein
VPVTELLYWSGIFICFWLLVGWCKWRYWEWLADRER